MKALLTSALAAVTLMASAAVPADYRKTEHRIPMRDGARLYTAVYAPEGADGSPILLMRTPYSCAPYGRADYGFLSDSIYKPYVEAGYIFAFQDVRGRWMSEGDGENVRPLTGPGGVDDATDAYDTFDWLVDSVPGNNGRIGIYGNSYCGYYALTAAASRHPALRAASPQAPVGDWFIGDDMHHNGAFAMMDAFGFAPYLATEKPHIPTDNYQFINGIHAEHPREFYLSRTISEVENSLGGRVAFLDSLFAHPDYDEFWQERAAVRFTDSLTTPMLVVGGHFDAEDLYGTRYVHRALLRNSPGLPVTLAMGPWAHGQWRENGPANALGDARLGTADLACYYRDEIEFPFFEYYLRDRGEAPIADHIFITGENRWFTGRFEDAETPARSFWLRADSVSAAVPQDGPPFSAYISDPADPVPFIRDEDYTRKRAYMTDGQRFLDGRRDVLNFVSAPMADSLRLVGPVTPELYVSVSGTDADFVVKVIDVAPDGSEMLVRGDIFRGRYRSGFDKPRPFIPGEIETVRFTMPDMAHTFLPGHRMKVQIQSSWFPLFDMNPQQFVDIYKATRSDFVPAEIRVWHSAEHPSRIIFGKD